MRRLGAVSCISHGVGKGDAAPEQREVNGAEEEKAQKADTKVKKESALDQFTVNLNEKARRGKVDPLIGRRPEVDRTVQILCRRSKNNPLYVGDPGVGKTAIAEGLARKIIEGDVRSEEHTSELQSLMRISYAVFCLTKKTKKQHKQPYTHYKAKPS